jgi:pimeloyl-ACP methyl ester carboxylesterase
MTAMTDAARIRPFTVDIPQEDIDALRQRIDETRWPNKELVNDRSQGVQLATMKELSRFWTNEYEWRECEDKLNALPQFKTEIDGVDVHFIHVESPHPNALPIIITHGWPGSVIELLDIIGPLTDPTSYGGSADDAFHVVLPSLPGYGFSQQPQTTGWDPVHTANAWAELMNRLGYSHYVAQGGDVGAAVTDEMGRLAPLGLDGIHLNFLRTALGRSYATQNPTGEEQAALNAINTFNTSGRGYFIEQATRPQTIGYALLDSPVALAAWMLDHDTDSYQKIARAFVDNQPSGNLTKKNVVDNITLYWLTGTGTSAAREYWDSGQAIAKSAGQAPKPVELPVGFTAFPGEIFKAPRSWVEKTYPNMSYYNQVDKGGHFAAWEEPQIFSREMRSAFGPLR